MDTIGEHCGLLAAKKVIETDAIKHVLRIMSTAVEWDTVPLNARTDRLRAVAWGMLSMALCLFQREADWHDRYPFMAYLMLGGEVSLQHVLDESCERGEWVGEWVELLETSRFRFGCHLRYVARGASAFFRHCTVGIITRYHTQGVSHTLGADSYGDLARNIGEHCHEDVEEICCKVQATL